MLRRPPRSTRTVTLVPCTTRFRSPTAHGILDTSRRRSGLRPRHPRPHRTRRPGIPRATTHRHHPTGTRIRATNASPSRPDSNPPRPPVLPCTRARIARKPIACPATPRSSGPGGNALRTSTTTTPPTTSPATLSPPPPGQHPHPAPTAPPTPPPPLPPRPTLPVAPDCWYSHRLSRHT